MERVVLPTIVGELGVGEHEKKPLSELGPVELALSDLRLIGDLSKTGSDFIFRLDRTFAGDLR